MHMAIPGARAIALAAVAALAVACNPPAQPGSNAGGAGSSGAATISVTSPADGATVTIPFEITVNAGVPLGDPSTGDHHLHLYFDTDTNATDYDIVYGSTAQVTRQLTPGPHTITIALANPDHSLAGPTVVLHVTVGSGGGGGSAGSAPPAPTYAPPAY